MKTNKYEHMKTRTTREHERAYREAIWKLRDTWNFRQVVEQLRSEYAKIETAFE